MEKLFRLSMFLCICFILASCASTSNRENPAQFMQSSVITVAMKTNLAADPDINSLFLSVSTYKSIVTLSGYADSYLEVYQTVQLAKQTEGVRAVVNNIVVRPTE